MTKTTVCISKPAQRDFKDLNSKARKAFTTYAKETLIKGEPSTLEAEPFKSVDSSIIEVKVSGRPAGRMFYIKVGNQVEILAYADKSRFGQDPKIKNKVEQRFKDFKQRS